MDELELAWERFRADPDAAGPFADLALPAVEAVLPADRFDPHLAPAAAVEAVYDLIRHPDRFDPAKGRLLPFLVLAARRDLRNLQDKEARHHRNRDHTDGVELRVAGRNEGQDDSETFADYPQFGPVVDGLSADERAVFELMLQGERAVAAFAVVLGLTDRPADEQAAEVKRVKDRILARLKRARGDT